MTIYKFKEIAGTTEIHIKAKTYMEAVEILHSIVKYNWFWRSTK